MLPPVELLRSRLRAVIGNKAEQGHVTDGLENELASLAGSYDAMASFARKLAGLPLRDEWPYVEPSDLDGIRAECDPARHKGMMADLDIDDAARRAEAAFLGSVAGCVLGKPLEVNPSLDEIRKAAEAAGEWPLRDYVTEETLLALGRRHGSWEETVRGRIRYVAPDDDVNYTVLGMLVLEKHGPGFTKDDLRAMWLRHLPVSMTFGPERTALIKAGIATLWREAPDLDEWVNVLNPNDEHCGALIRADAYGYACPGRPEFASELAWRDSSFTHRRTGIYGSMFVAAAVAAAEVASRPGGDALAVFGTALRYVPRRSRFHRIAADSLEEVSRASDWLDGYARVHRKYAEYAHCRIFQEVGTVMNTLRFAESVGDGIAKQVSQGNDTDSFGATAGSILGAFFGPGHLEDRWLAPFNDEIRTTLAQFYERSLSKLARRMGELPALVARQLSGEAKRASRNPTREGDPADGL